MSGIALMLLVAVPWFWLVSERNPEFLRFFFIHEHWQRYTSNVHSRKGPLLYFVPLVLGGFLPWLGLVPRMWRAVRERAGVTAGSAPRPFQPALLAAIWAIAIFVFFSLSHSKLPGYILPVFPALGILGGVALDSINERSWRRQLVGGLAIGIIGLLASPIVATLNSNNTPNALYRAYAIWVAVAFGLMIASTLAARWLLPRRGLMASITVYAIGMCTAFSGALLGHEVIGRSASGIDMIAPVARVLRPEMKLYSVRVLDHTLPFYLRHTLVMVERPDELEFGVTQEPRKWQPTTASFLAAWQDGQPAMAIMSPDTFAELSQRAPMYVVARDWRRVAVTNFAVNAPAPQR